MAAFYHIASRDYLRRAEERLSEDRYESMFYAAFELRCGIEARMEEYLQVWEHIAEKKKTGWSIVNLGRNIEEAFRTGDSVVRWAVHDRQSKRLIVCLYHTPVTKQLQERGKKLGNYMHSAKQLRPVEDPWWSMFRHELLTTARELRIANTGTLLGPPLMKSGTRNVQMSLEMPPGSEADEIMKKITGQDLTVDISYPDALPEILEPEASVWPNAS